MVEVNPQVQPVQDPNYLFWSRPIQQFEGDKSKGIALSAVGTGIEEGVKATDTAVKSGIEQDMREKVEEVQNEYQDQLAAADPQGQRPQNVLAPRGDVKPAGLETLPQTVGTLIQAKANGRLSETDYKGRLDTIAKDFRAQYTGYKPFIDDTIRSLTGFRNTANEYIQSMVSDINAANAKADSEKNKIRNQIIEHPYPGSEGILQQLDNNEISQYEAFKWFVQIKGTENAWHYDKLKFDHVTDVRAANGVKMEDKISARADQIASMYANNMFAIVGENQKQKLFDTISEAGTQGTAGNKMSDEQWMGLGSTVDTVAFSARRGIHDVLHERNSEGQSYASIYGETKAKAIENNSMTLFDQASKAINDKDRGLAFRHLHQASSKMADFNTGVLKDYNMAAIAGFNHFLTTFGGPNALKDSVGLSLLSSSVSTEMRDRFTFDRLKAISQGTPGDNVYRGSAQPTVTVKSLLNKAEADGINEPGYNKAIAEFAPTDFLDPKYRDTPMQLNAAKALFSPANEGAILRFNRDVVENGRQVPGYQHVFNTWFSDKMTDEAHRVGQTHPEVWDMYRTSAEKNYGIILTHEINNLNSWQNFGDVVLNYDAKTHHFSATLGNNPTQKGAEHLKPFSHNPMVLDQVNTELGRLNNSSDRMVKIAEKIKGFDPDIYLLNTLRQRGADLSKVNDISGKVFRSISTAKYAEEDPENKGSLSSFLANPAGSTPAKKNNAPAASSVAPRGNLGDILGIQVDNIPEGMSARDFIKQLQSGK